MNLPLDIPALLKAATDIDEARNTPLAVSVYIDAVSYTHLTLPTT